MPTVTYALQAIAASVFLSASSALLLRPRYARAFWKPFPASTGPRVLVAFGALLSSLGLGFSIAVPFFAFFAAVLGGIIALSFGAYASWKGARKGWLFGVFALILCAAIGVLQPLGLKVMNLPKADVLPNEPVPGTVVKTYGEGVWFESVRAGPDGTLYLAANLGLDFNTADSFRTAHGEVISRRPNGAEQILFVTPRGSTAGVFAISPDGTLYMSSNGDDPGIWRIAQDGTGSMLSHLPRGAWPNGLDFGPDGQLYAPDSSLGAVWRIDPRNGHAEVAVRHPSLSARPYIALAPGANGLHFLGADMIVTVSDRTKVLRFTLSNEGTFGPPQEVATGIPGDDFAIGPDGSLFITTHPYNTVVRVEPDGRRSVIAGLAQNVEGPTDATFGRTDADRDTLYVATDGGAFTGGAGARGKLLALKPYANQ